ncbi:hypothetical protein CDCA_CDCA05G1516 [Cyanidium caldarium]|uniref:Protein translocase subunit SecA n=1 Tax=Cyanidium caldarium TaxID=2771 RepID=A0AAV9ITI9_CYACA|nr:hypothetical protein CDCA_CDCA05G1516 [Cyanidium caldarium]
MACRYWFAFVTAHAGARAQRHRGPAPLRRGRALLPLHPVGHGTVRPPSDSALGRGRAHRGWQMNLLDGLRKAVRKGLGDERKPARSPQTILVQDDRALQRYEPRVKRVNELEDAIEQLSDEDLAAKTAEFRRRAQAGGGDVPVEEAFAVAREAAFRVLGLRHYDVQVLGGLALLDGCVAEIATGEGKTLVAVLPAYVAALTGRGTSFVVTVNDYLARRDYETMGQVFRFLGLSVGLVHSGSTPEERRRAYACDISYVTNSELGFDYLRDHLALSVEAQVLVGDKPFYFCLLDEADSIMIDEARTPLIISQSVAAPSAKYEAAAKLVQYLRRGHHYEVLERERTVTLTEEGESTCEQALKVPSLYDASESWAQLVLNALKAKELFRRDVEYVVRDAQVLIVDENTGRVLEGRRWSDGLHQAVEAKERIPVLKETQTAASISYQSFFRLFPALCGMTGTIATDAAEVQKLYGLWVARVPTALPVARKDYPDVVFKTQRGKLRAVMREVRRLHRLGAPVLVGTTSIEASEQLSRYLNGEECDGDATAATAAEPVPHDVLNARPESAERESEIVAQAGRRGAVTVATNMAGRGTDILLGGNADFIAQVYVRERLLRELARRGHVQVVEWFAERMFPALEAGQEASLTEAIEQLATYVEEQLLLLELDAEWRRRFQEQPRDTLRTVIATAMDFGRAATDEPSLERRLRQAVEQCAETFTPVMERERKAVLDAGGLQVIGTERHESRRVDNQLRGRAGRQGDPGTSRFFLALDDDLFRVFGGDRVRNIVDAFRISETTPIESERVTEALNAVQMRVEQYYADMRQTLFAYDEVLATQRQVLYTQRNRMLRADAADLLQVEDDGRDGASVRGVMAEWVRQTVMDIVPNFVNDRAGALRKLEQFFPGIALGAGDSFTAADFEPAAQAALRVLQDKCAALRQRAPTQDTAAFRYLALVQYDRAWARHLKELGFTRDFASLQSLKQVDPVQEFQRQGYALFQRMQDTMRRDTVYSFFQYDPEQAAR